MRGPIRGSAKRIVKIAPGHNGQFWDACRDGGYICVGWDEIGDLKQFESKEEFRRAFGEAYTDYAPGEGHREGERSLDAHGAPAR